MNQDRWSRVQQLFESAVELEPEEQQKLLAAQCGDDATLRREVESLLAHAKSGDSLSEVVASAAAAVLDESPANPDIGLELGPYRIVREIAQGGMGVVYLAVRGDAHFSHVAAVKLVRSGIHSERFLKRLRGERQLLADLNHPNIATIYDGGATADGRPYIVMEYIEGKPLYAFCENHQLGIAERVKLVETICRAVEYAHGKRVLHRDIKPDNILVTPEGVVKLVDFGVAKLLSPEAGRADQSSSQFRFVTPAYASPEQLLGKRISPASDLFSLGVVLHKLLTGQNPSAGVSSQPFQLAMAISKNLPSQTPGLNARLRRCLKGDLDAIISHATEFEPGARYSSAGQLAEDLRRWRKRLPVSARQAGPWYPVSKWLERNRLAAGCIALTLALLVAGVAVVAGLMRGNTARDQQLSAIGALLWQRLEEDLNVPPSTAAERAALARRTTALLDTIGSKQHSQLPAPKARARGYRASGDLFRSAGEIDAALRSYEQAIDSDPDGSTCPALSRAGMALCHASQGNLERASQLAASALSVDSTGPPRAVVLFSAAEVLSQTGDTQQSRQLRGEACALATQLEQPLSSSLPTNPDINRWLDECPAERASE